jgi:succinoglycan biosynthesis transport protein ExoP
MQRTLKTAADAQRLGATRILGFLPKAPSPGDARDGVVDVPDLTPWLVQTVAGLARDRRETDGKVILVTSALRGEGRSIVAINLAASLATSEHRTLLIEADRAEHVKNPPHGLLDVLSEGNDLGAALVEQTADGYTLLPYGGRDMKDQVASGALLNSVTFRATLKLARAWFDVIVIDGSPVLESSNARFLAAEADQTLLVVEWDKTDADDVAAALERLEADDPALLFNKSDPARLKLYEPEQSRQLESVGLAA